ncbi:hypothetical protein FDECE_3580 [Fusarium decemcellulare]|nr:hypothetical protein FDECE_3580 [Fusarium decemcellulare]
MGFSKESKKIASKATSKITQEVIRERDKALSRPSTETKQKDDLVDEIVRAAAASIGFVSEAMHHRRERKKARAQASSDQSGQDETDSPAQVNEAIWKLDEAEQEAAPPETKSPSPKEPKELARAFIERHPFYPDEICKTELELPVILPQRRPSSRARGFVRAYSPSLAQKGIDQDTFLDFIDTFNKTLVPNPWLYAINLAGFAGTGQPEPFGMLIGAAAEIAALAAMEMQSRFKSNGFLDHVNRSFFVPRGMACFVMTWKPDADEDMLTSVVNLDGRTAESSAESSLSHQMKDIITQKTPRSEGISLIQQQMKERIKSSSGTCKWPESSPLVFPSLEDTNGKGVIGGNTKKKNSFGSAEKWIDGYQDKRAQAKWMAENPDEPATRLVPKPHFQSRYADPNHPAASGDVVALLTGGRWQYGQGKSVDRKEKKKDEDKDSDLGKEDDAEKKTGEKDKHSSKEIEKKSDTGILKSLLQKDVLYLAIVNIPSVQADVEQLTEAAQLCDAQGQESGLAPKIE